MNIFFVLKTKEGEVEVVTPPLTRGDILPGVTRRSILELASDSGKYKVSERHIAMPEIRDAWKEGRLMEAFGAGTAAIISPVNRIHYEGENIEVRTRFDERSNCALAYKKVLDEMLEKERKEEANAKLFGRAWEGSSLAGESINTDD